MKINALCQHLRRKSILKMTSLNTLDKQLLRVLKGEKWSVKVSMSL